jgi:glycerophosphoryl diester phosphodiesterase
MTTHASWPAGNQALVIAHRGASRLAPENSLEAVDLAIRLGADMVEFDVRRTRDGVLIAHHNATIRRRAIQNLTYAEDLSGRAPATLDQILRLAAGRIQLDVELKEEGYEEEALEVITASMPTQDFVVTSFSERTVSAAKQLGVRAGLLWHRVAHHETLFAHAERCGADLIAPHHRLAGELLLREAEARAIPLLLWTVNQARHMDEYLAHPAVNGVITDVPDRALAIRGGEQRPAGFMERQEAI